VRADYFDSIQISKHIDESDIVRPDTEFVLKPENFIFRVSYSLQDGIGGEIILARYAVSDRVGERDFVVAKRRSVLVKIKRQYRP
jgi:hypothetical protein